MQSTVVLRYDGVELRFTFERYRRLLAPLDFAVKWSTRISDGGEHKAILTYRYSISDTLSHTV